MKIYIDLILILNFFLDFLLLITVSLILKRNAKILRITLGALIGSVSMLALFINFSSFTLFLFKVLISIIMTMITFGFINIKEFFYNIFYLYIVSIILGGFLYLINDTISYKKIGLIFFHNGFSINYIIIILSSPIIIYIYIKSTKKLKFKYNKRYEVTITFLNNKKLNLTGFLDTGNNLYDPYKKRPIIIINKDLIKDYKPKFILVPIITVNKDELMKCFKIKKIVINGRIIKDECLVGISDINFKNIGVDLLLHKKIIKEEL